MLEPKPRLGLFMTDYSLRLLGLRDGCMKLIYELESRRARLYDICADPSEREDLSERFPERVTSYTKHLLDWSASQRALVLSGGK